MIAVLGGLAAAGCFSVSALLGQRASRAIGEIAAFAWMALWGLLLCAAPAIVGVLCTRVSAVALVQLAVAGALNVVGLVMMFAALRRGRVSMIAPITSSEGAIAALVAAIGGAALGVAVWVALGAVLTGVAVVAWGAAAGSGDHAGEGGGAGGSSLPAIALACLAAAAFGTELYLQGHAGAHVPLGLAIAPASAMGAALVTGPAAAIGRLGSPRGAVAATLGLGMVEVLGFVGYIIGARHSVPVTAMCSSQYATIAVIVGVVFLHERPTRLQYLGYGLIIAGVAAVSIAQ
jgi:drug/metabolite transporter (DMT)-like permease